MIPVLRLPLPMTFRNDLPREPRVVPPARFPERAAAGCSTEAHPGKDVLQEHQRIPSSRRNTPCL